MPPAASDEPSFLNTTFPGDNSPPSQDSIPVIRVPETSSKGKKKGKNGSKGKDKVAKSAIQTIPDELAQPSPPSQSEPSSYPNATFSRPANNPVVSPVLDALGSFENNPDNETAYRTGAWAKSIPFGKSPPNDLIDTAFASGSPLGFPSHVERGGFSHVSSSASPPARAWPMSYGNGQLSITPSRHQSADRQKRHSMGAGQFPIQPPLPHLPQAHFYGAPEIDLPPFSTGNRPTTDRSYSFCAFDSIPGPSLKPGKMGGKVLVVGMDGSVDVLAIESRKTRLIGKITGLNGRVLDAKLLPYTSQLDPYASSRPHVAVIVHGPVTHKDDGGDSSSAGSEPNEILPGLPGKPSSYEKQQGKEEAVYYQTRVEVLSLRTGDLVTTLFTSKLVPCFDNFPNLSLYAPPPVGNLRILANGNFVVVASGISGEVFIYGIVAHAAPNAYQCLAKTWTSVQSRDSRRYSTSSSSTDQEGSQADTTNGLTSSDNPIISLSGRWLAVVPPSISSRAPPLGTVPAHLIQKKIHGLEAQIPPSKPSVTCATDSGEGESLFDKVARGVTQELFRGARWMGDQGLQAWNNYWNKDQQSSQNGNIRRPNQFSDTPQPGHTMFPPTHGQDTSGMSSLEPDVVSIFDLRKLEDSQETRTSFPGPIATFQAPNGCSFLSLSPSGLMLLTASKKGDIQYVWDLMQIKHCRTAALVSDELTVNNNNNHNTISPHVRQVSRYTRLTTSSIIDVIWTYPTGERLAIITRKGTVHVFDIPRTAFQWPPLRRVRPKPHNFQTEDSTAATIQPDETGSGSSFAAAMKLVGGTTQPILAAVRGRAPSAGNTFPAVTGFGISSAAGVSGKAVAAGLSKSVGAATGTVNTLRHVGENRLHLVGFSRDPVASRVTWISARDECLLGVMDGGCFKLYKIKRGTNNQRTRRNQPVIGGKIVEFKLPPYLYGSCGPLQLGFSTDVTVNASWAFPSTPPHSSSATKLKSQPLSQAEIETNAPCQPFHTDRRVNLYVFSGTEENYPAVAPSTGQWVFGNDIPFQKLHIRPLNHSDDEDVLPGQPVGVGEMENLISLGNGNDQVEEVVITTRRKKKHSNLLSTASPRVNDDDGFFEDDCDVLDFARDRV